MPILLGVKFCDKLTCFAKRYPGLNLAVCSSGFPGLRPWRCLCVAPTGFVWRDDLMLRALGANACPLAVVVSGRRVIFAWPARLSDRV